MVNAVKLSEIRFLKSYQDKILSRADEISAKTFSPISTLSDKTTKVSTNRILHALSEVYNTDTFTEETRCALNGHLVTKTLNTPADGSRWNGLLTYVISPSNSGNLDSFSLNVRVGAVWGTSFTIPDVVAHLGITGPYNVTTRVMVGSNDDSAAAISVSIDIKLMHNGVVIGDGRQMQNKVAYTDYAGMRIANQTVIGITNSGILKSHLDAAYTLSKWPDEKIRYFERTHCGSVKADVEVPVSYSNADLSAESAQTVSEFIGAGGQNTGGISFQNISATHLSNISNGFGTQCTDHVKKESYEIGITCPRTRHPQAEITLPISEVFDMTKSLFMADSRNELRLNITLASKNDMIYHQPSGLEVVVSTKVIVTYLHFSGMAVSTVKAAEIVQYPVEMVQHKYIEGGEIISADLKYRIAKFGNEIQTALASRPSFAYASDSFSSLINKVSPVSIKVGDFVLEDIHFSSAKPAPLNRTWWRQGHVISKPYIKEKREIIPMPPLEVQGVSDIINDVPHDGLDTILTMVHKMNLKGDRRTDMIPKKMFKARLQPLDGECYFTRRKYMGYMIYSMPQIDTIKLESDSDVLVDDMKMKDITKWRLSDLKRPNIVCGHPSDVEFTPHHNGQMGLTMPPTNSIKITAQENYGVNSLTSHLSTTTVFVSDVNGNDDSNDDGVNTLKLPGAYADLTQEVRQPSAPEAMYDFTISTRLGKYIKVDSSYILASGQV